MAGLGFYLNAIPINLRKKKKHIYTCWDLFDKWRLMPLLTLKSNRKKCIESDFCVCGYSLHGSSSNCSKFDGENVAHYRREILFSLSNSLFADITLLASVFILSLCVLTRVCITNTNSEFCLNFDESWKLNCIANTHDMRGTQSRIKTFEWNFDAF